MKLDDDDFTLFGLPAQFVLDRAVLDTRWKALQAEVHPDRFVLQGAAAQRVAMQWAVRVNEAYQRLKDPLKRAAYLCEQHGTSVQADHNTAMPTDFLMQQMTWREELEAAPDVRTAEQLAQRVQADRQARLAVLAQTLDRDQDWLLASVQVRALMFLDRFLTDVNQRIEALES